MLAALPVAAQATQPAAERSRPSAAHAGKEPTLADSPWLPSQTREGGRGYNQEAAEKRRRRPTGLTRR